MRNFKLILTALILLSCLCVSGLPQNPVPIGIRPEPPEGKGVVALRAARLIDADLMFAETSARMCVDQKKWWVSDRRLTWEAWQRGRTGWVGSR